MNPSAGLKPIALYAALGAPIGANVAEPSGWIVTRFSCVTPALSPSETNADGVVQSKGAADAVGAVSSAPASAAAATAKLRSGRACPRAIET